MELIWESLIALVTLTALEIVLGIDNIVFIAILAGRLPVEQRQKARQLGLAAAMLMRIALLLSITWIMGLTTPLVTIEALGQAGEISGKDIILALGGMFLLAKSTHEIHAKLEGTDEHGNPSTTGKAALGSVVVQIMLMDIIFSLDSVITAVGMARQLWVMIAAVVIAVGVMMIFARSISDFVERHPTVKMLALSFLLLIGVMLVADAFDQHIPKGYIYFAMAFSLTVEMLNLRLRKPATPVQLHRSHLPERDSR